VTDWVTAKLRELEEWRSISGEEQDLLIASGWHPGDCKEFVSDRYQDGDPPHNAETAPRRGNVRGHDTTEVPVMQAESNPLHVRVTYATDCPEWWRIQIRRRLGRQGMATRAECVEWLRRYGSSQDDDLWLEWDRWQKAADEGEEVAGEKP
jgi:hypothetical protein